MVAARRSLGRFQAQEQARRCQCFGHPVRQPIFPRQIGKGTFLTLQNRHDGKLRTCSTHRSLATADDRDRDRLARRIKAGIKHAINYDGLGTVCFGLDRGIDDSGCRQNFINRRFDRGRALCDLSIRHSASVRCGQSGDAKACRHDWRDDVDPAQNESP